MDNEKKIQGMSRAMDINKREWNTLIKEKSTILIQDAVRDAMDMLQNEVIKMMEQLSVLKEIIRKKDLQLKRCCV